MGNLRDQLKKANVLSDKDARRLAHEERVHRSEVGRAGLEREDEERRKELARLRDESRADTQAAQSQLDEQRQAALRRAECGDLLEREVVPAGSGGRTRWFFEVEDGSLPWLDLNDLEFKRLLSGDVVIVRRGPPGSHAYGLLNLAHALRVREFFPERIAWWPPGHRR
jgi:uncharacterized protein YaiL (DUF2058 family)